MTVHSTGNSRRGRAPGRTLLAIVATLAMTSCGNDDITTPNSPTPTSCTLTNLTGCVTETFTGTVNQNGAVTHNFSSVRDGAVTATLSVLSPDSAQVIGMSVGTFAGTTCTTVLSNDRSTQGTVITGSVSSVGSLCVRAYDVGTISAAQPFSYEITILHP